LLARLSIMPLLGWRHWCRHGNFADLKGQGRIPRSSLAEARSKGWIGSIECGDERVWKSTSDMKEGKKPSNTQ